MYLNKKTLVKHRAGLKPGKRNPERSQPSPLLNEALWAVLPQKILKCKAEGTQNPFADCVRLSALHELFCFLTQGNSIKHQLIIMCHDDQ
jgi:hypothetical protein